MWLVDLIAPPRCLACVALLGARERDLCAGCRGALPWLAAPRCSRCALPWHGGRACPAAGFAFDAAWAAHAHAGPARDLVHALKRRGRIPVADLIAAQLAAGAPAELWRDAVLVPVPAHPGRRRSRGVDHARLIAVRLGRRLQRPVVSCLTRRGERGDDRQAGSSRLSRLRAGPQMQTRGAAPAVALLVDDVHTTGATLHACALALRAAGCEKVYALTYTRAL